MRICWFMILLLALPLAGVAQAVPDEAVIRAGTHVVLMNVVAKDKHGKPVADLTRDDFVLRDSGREQKIWHGGPGFAGQVDVHQQAAAGDRGGDRVPVR